MFLVCSQLVARKKKTCIPINALACSPSPMFLLVVYIYIYVPVKYHHINITIEWCSVLFFNYVAIFAGHIPFYLDLTIPYFISIFISLFQDPHLCWVNPEFCQLYPPISPLLPLFFLVKSQVPQLQDIAKL